METGRLEALKEALDELGAEGAKVNHRRIGVGIPLVEMAHGPTRTQEPLVAQCPCLTAVINSRASLSCPSRTDMWTFQETVSDMIECSK